MHERDFPEPNLEDIQKSNILIIAPATYPLIAAIDVRPSIHSYPTIVTLHLDKAMAPCPQLPDVKIEVDPSQVHSLIQTYRKSPKENHPIITQLVSRNIINHLNDIRVGMADEVKTDYKTFMLLIGAFSTFSESDIWNKINEHLAKTQPSALVLDANEFIRRQAEWEKDDVGYITGQNNSTTIWQRQ